MNMQMRRSIIFYHRATVGDIVDVFVRVSAEIHANRDARERAPDFYAAHLSPEANPTIADVITGRLIGVSFRCNAGQHGGDGGGEIVHVVLDGSFLQGQMNNE
jgi:hypothetical protein